MIGMKNFQNQPWYKTIIAIWGEQTNLTAQLRPLTKRAKKLFFHLPEFINFQKCYYSHHSCFKIITLTIQTNAGERSNTRKEKHASNSNHGRE
jgi:hypothetical protein